MSAPLEAWCGTAVAIAEEAGRGLVDQAARMHGVRTEFKGRRELVTVADREAERVVVEGLRGAFPGHAVLAEEGVLTPRGRADREGEWCWIVDPLDGTTNFVHGLPFYAVAIGLARGRTPVLGVVHAPALGWTFRGWQGGGAFLGDGRLEVSDAASIGDALLATGFSYDRNEPDRDDNTGRVAAVIPACRDLRRFGSAELDLCLVARGAFDGYWEIDLMPYDVAAGGLLVREAGGTVTDLDGGDDWVFGRSVCASNGRVHGELLGLVGNAGGGRPMAR